MIFRERTLPCGAVAAFFPATGMKREKDFHGLWDGGAEGGGAGNSPAVKEVQAVPKSLENRI